MYAGQLRPKAYHLRLKSAFCALCEESRSGLNGDGMITVYQAR